MKPEQIQSQLTRVISDAIGGSEGLRLALAWSAIGGPLATIAFWAGRPALVRDIEG